MNAEMRRMEEKRLNHPADECRVGTDGHVSVMT
jgi:hypothetical protein